MGFVELPPGDLRLVDVSVPAALIAGPVPGPIDADGVTRADFAIAGGRIAGIGPARSGPGIDLKGAMAWPTFTDLHTHLDKGHIWPRAQNPQGNFIGAVETVRGDRDANWSVADMRARMEFGLKAAYAHGTGAIRTHLDSYPAHIHKVWPLFVELRDKWAGKIALQAVNITTIDLIAGAFAIELADLVQRSGGVFGAVTRLAGGVHDAIPVEFHGQVETVLRLAMARDLDVDFHVDESGESGARALGIIAATALRLGFKRRITCGHCCSLAVQPEDLVRKTLADCANAGIAVVSLPMCNLYLQDRMPGRTPRWRGVTLLHEIKAAGIPVSVASDNCRDPFYAYGDHDMLEVTREATRIAHLDRPFADWPRAFTMTPADVMGLRGGRIAVGGPADVVLFRARAYSELLSRHQADRVVIRDGRVIDAVLPDYAELDHLFARGRA